LVDKESLDVAKELKAKAGDKLVLPVDNRVADDFDNDANMKVISASESVPAGWEVLDVGPETVEAFKEILGGAKTVVWNGPVGVFEMSNFAKGTFGIAEALAELTDTGVTTIIGGGDSAAATERAGLAEKMTHISTGGGASLELLEGKTLPGLAALADKEQ
ncbi:MAG: phosphoglycerate kinase, partial [Chloroflexota bacterium]